MSRLAVNWAWDIQIKPASLKLILLSMADRADEYHSCYPSISRLVTDTCLDKKTVQAGLVKLVDAGVIVDTGKRRGPTGRVKVFRLVINDKPNSASETNVPKNGNIPKNGIITQSNDPESGNINLPNNGIITPPNDPENGILNDPENGIQNLTIEPKRSLKDLSPSKSKKSEFDFSSWPAMPSEQTLADWIAIRKAKKSPLNQTAINRLAKQLHQAEAAGFAVEDCIATCAARGWVGFEAAWLVNAGVRPASGGAAGDWPGQVFNEGDPLI